MVTQFPVDVGEGRSLPNVLKRISSLLALKSTVSIMCIALVKGKHLKKCSMF
jgi:hypothetical protein